MADLDRYLTAEVIEKAAKALADDWNPERDPILSAMFRDYARTALSAVADDLRAEGKAEAQEDALQRLARAAFLVDSIHHFHGTQCSCGFTGNARKRTQTEHITAEVLEAYDHD